MASEPKGVLLMVLYKPGEPWVVSTGNEVHHRVTELHVTQAGFRLVGEDGLEVASAKGEQTQEESSSLAQSFAEFFRQPGIERARFSQDEEGDEPASSEVGQQVLDWMGRSE